MLAKEISEPFLKFNEKLWGIILAGGEGNRLKSFVEKIYGYHRPKQFCKIAGPKSMINHTIDRARMIIPKEKIYTVVTKHHKKFISEEITNQPKDTIVIQPSSKETGAGIILPLIKIFKRDPNSTILILPSDHFIEEENRFMRYANNASFFIDENPNLIALFGVKPRIIESGCGWIETNEKVEHKELSIKKVKRFWEKPTFKVAEELFNNDCLINTFVMLGKSRTLLKYFKEQTPSLFKSFLPLLINEIPEREKFLIDRIFLSVPEVNFSHEFLTKICDNLCVIELNDVYWNDWGEEQRILNDLERIYNNERRDKPITSVELSIFN